MAVLLRRHELMLPPPCMPVLLRRHFRACRPGVQAAVCAAGALANLAVMAAEGSMPEGGSGAQAAEDGSHSRDGAAAHDALVQALAAALAGGAVYHSLGLGMWPRPLAAQTDGH